MWVYGLECQVHLQADINKSTYVNTFGAYPHRKTRPSKKYLHGHELVDVINCHECRRLQMTYTVDMVETQKLRLWLMNESVTAGDSLQLERSRAGELGYKQDDAALFIDLKMFGGCECRTLGGTEGDVRDNDTVDVSHPLRGPISRRKNVYLRAQPVLHVPHG